MPVNVVTFADGNILYAANLISSFNDAVAITGDAMTGPLSIQGIDIGSGLKNAYNAANGAFTQANNAYNQANAATNSATAAYLNSNAAFTAANNATTANVTPAFNQANAAFAAANTAAANTVYIFGINATQNAGIAAVNTYSISAFSQANSAYTQANAATSSASAAYGQANAAYVQANAATNSAQAAYNKANSVVGGITSLSFAFLTSNGTTQAQATALTANINFVTSVATNTGVIITAPIGSIQYVANRGANTLNVFPNIAAAIESLAANAPYQMANTYCVGFFPTAANQIYAIIGGPASFGL